MAGQEREDVGEVSASAEQAAPNAPGERMWGCPIPSGEHVQHRTPTHIHTTHPPNSTHTSRRPVIHTHMFASAVPVDP
eukprot:973848-Prymnesium_polylepis.1